MKINFLTIAAAHFVIKPKCFCYLLFAVDRKKVILYNMHIKLYDGAWCNWQHTGFWYQVVQVRILARQPFFIKVT